MNRYIGLTTDDLRFKRFTAAKLDSRHNSSRRILKTSVLSTTPCSASVPGPLPNATTSSTVTSADFV